MNATEIKQGKTYKIKNWSQNTPLIARVTKPKSRLQYRKWLHEIEWVTQPSAPWMAQKTELDSNYFVCEIIENNGQWEPQLSKSQQRQAQQLARKQLERRQEQERFLVSVQNLKTMGLEAWPANARPRRGERSQQVVCLTRESLLQLEQLLQEQAQQKVMSLLNEEV